MNIAIIPAGGQGRRMAGSAPKQFLSIGGVPIIIHTLRRFEACPDIDAVIVVLPADEAAAGSFEKLVQEYGLSKVLPPTAGASERQGSVYCGLRAIAETPSLDSQAEIVSIHDAVRPFITPEMISETVRAAKSVGAAICAVPAVDTIKEVIDGRITRTLPRSLLYQAQTPQTFRYRLILEAHRRAEEDGFFATDDAMLVERAGYPVAVVEGSPDNIKITKPSDLAFAELILSRK